MRRVKRKGVIAAIAGAARAVVSTLTDAERLHHKMEPHVSPDPEEVIFGGHLNAITNSWPRSEKQAVNLKPAAR